MKYKVENWKVIIEIVGVVGGLATFLALTLGPMLYLGSKIDNKFESLRSQMHSDMNEFRQEMKEFHGRLCILEERNKK